MVNMKRILEILVDKAKEARKNAYAPYSKFKVGAAVLADNNEIYTGVNVENASYGLTICAERVAVFKAVSEGAKQIKAVAIVADTDAPVPPCGACRQVILEFATKECKIVMANLQGKKMIKTIDELLPYSFTSEVLNE